MATLEIDIGNTRLKWRLRVSGELASSRALVRSDFSSVEYLLSSLAKAVSETALAVTIKRVVIGSVAAGNVEAGLARWSLDQYGVDAEFAYVVSGCCGIEVGYGDPARLGVDRWLAVLAASRRGLDSVAVVDCGSAITVDILHQSVHQGGYIVPGLQMMHESLFKETAQVRALPAVGAGEPGKSTDAAVNNGLSLMVAGFLLSVFKDLSLAGWWRKPGSCRVLITGGDAGRVVDILNGAADIKGCAIEVLDDLVLDGLELVDLRRWPWS